MTRTIHTTWGCATIPDDLQDAVMSRVADAIGDLYVDHVEDCDAMGVTPPSPFDILAYMAKHN